MMRGNEGYVQLERWMVVEGRQASRRARFQGLRKGARSSAPSAGSSGRAKISLAGQRLSDREKQAGGQAVSIQGTAAKGRQIRADGARAPTRHRLVHHSLSSAQNSRERHRALNEASTNLLHRPQQRARTSCTHHCNVANASYAHRIPCAVSGARCWSTLLQVGAGCAFGDWWLTCLPQERVACQSSLGSGPPHSASLALTTHQLRTPVSYPYRDRSFIRRNASSSRPL